MDNFLDNGTVLPSGLVGIDSQAMMGGFNKNYRNTALRMGIVVSVYLASDARNLTKLTTEYDVLVFEQMENRGSTIVTYRNCIATESLGSIPDFLEKTLRVRQGQPSGNNGAINTVGQNGSVVLIQCLDGMSDKAIIVGSVTHPNRNTTLTNTGPYLQGEYNGVNLVIDTDGSVTLTFKGATDNDGKQVDSSQGNTVAKIEADGSVEVNNAGVILRLDKNGAVSLTAKDTLNLDITGNVTVKTDGDLTATVSGDCNANISGNLVANASEIDLNGSSGAVLTNITDPVVDTIFGTPTMGVETVKAG